MTTLENIANNQNVIREGSLTHHKHFMNTNGSTRDSWYSRRRFGY